MNTQTGPILKLMTRKERARHITAEFGISMSPLTLDTLASQGGGPKYVKFGRHAYYQAADIETWVKCRMSRKFTSTSDEHSGLQ